MSFFFQSFTVGILTGKIISDIIFMIQGQDQGQKDNLKVTFM